MSYNLRLSERLAHHWPGIVLAAVLSCSGQTTDPGPLVTPSPGAVSDFAVSDVSDASATVSFTQVDDGTGNPAKYDVRYTSSPMSWGSATSATIGTCATPVAGTAIGAPLSCTVLGLLPSTNYNFQLIAFRGTMNENAVYGGLSNVVAASTTAPPAPPPPNAVVTNVTVAPPSASIAAGATVSLQATVTDQNGNVMSGQAIAWSTNNAAAATVSSSGVVTGLAAGSATISATSSDKIGTSSITVTAAPPPTPVVTTVTVAPPSASIVAGGTVSLQATVKDQNGNVMSGQAIAWSTNNAAAATVSSSGVVTGVAAGSATISATSSGKVGTSSITVTAAPPPTPVVTTVTVAPASASIVAGATVSLQAIVKDQNGNVMSGQPTAWSTNNAAAATVDLSGIVTGIAAGSATITATSSGKSGMSNITVTAPPPPPPPGGTLLFQENFEDANLASRGWYDNTGVVLSTTEHIAGSNSSAQWHWLPGATNPVQGGAQRHKFTPSTGFYVSYYLKFSANWVGSNQAYHPHEMHAMTTMDSDYEGPSYAWMTVYLEHSYQNGGRPRMAMQDNKAINTSYGTPPHNLIGVTEDRSTGGCNGVAESNLFTECFAFNPWYNSKQVIGPVVFQPNPGPNYKNDWNFVEAYFKLNTISNGVGQADGVMQYWLNGTLIIDRHDIVFRTSARPTMLFNQFIIAPYIGDGSPVDQSMFIDNLRVATARIP
jgi:uncharacterized protein YjdB